MTTLTTAQRRALDWLPSDGTWRTIARAAQSIDLIFLEDSHPELVERRVHSVDWRLTPAGIARKAQMEETNG